MKNRHKKNVRTLLFEERVTLRRKVCARQCKNIGKAKGKANEA
jgi:hypothetical protein